MTRITLTVVKNLRPGSQVWDSTLRGFGARRRAEAVTYVVKYRAGRGRSATQRFLTLGQHSEAFPPERARQEAKKLLGLVADGKDPAASRATERRAGTLTDLAAAFQAANAKKWRPSTVRTNAALIARAIQPMLGSRRPNELTHGDVVRWHVSLGDTPGAANRALAILSSMLSWAIKHQLREAPNPCRDVKRYRSKKIERHLSPQELGRLGEVLTKAEAREPYAVAAVRLLLFTGARLGEVLGLRWDWIDTEAGLVCLPDSKTGPKTLYLNPPALMVLSDVRRVDGNPHVIVGAKNGAPLVNLEKAWRRYRNAAGLSDVRLHDLRHTFASIGAAAGEGLPIIGRLLGHRTPTTTSRYAHLSNGPVRVASEKISGLIATALTGKTNC